MKRITTCFMAFIATSMMFTSCLKDTENSATISFVPYLTTDSIIYSDPADSVFTEDIITALYKEEKLGYNALFEASSKTASSVDYAIYDCYNQAITYYNNFYKDIDLAYIKKIVYSVNTDSLNKLGYIGSESLPIDAFKMKPTIVDNLTSNWTSVSVSVE